jgi:hypothetical protein
MVNDLPKTIRHSYSGMYADDKIIWDQNQNLSILQKEIEVDASMVLEWYAKLGFKLSPSKTTSIVFFLRKVPEKMMVTIGGAEVTVQIDAKILGGNFDRKVSWKKHMEEGELSCNKSIKILRTLSGTKWGPIQVTL